MGRTLGFACGAAALGYMRGGFILTDLLGPGDYPVWQRGEKLFLESPVVMDRPAAGYDDCIPHEGAVKIAGAAQGDLRVRGIHRSIETAGAGNGYLGSAWIKDLKQRRILRGIGDRPAA